MFLCTCRNTGLNSKFLTIDTEIFTMWARFAYIISYHPSQECYAVTYKHLTIPWTYWPALDSMLLRIFFPCLTHSVLKTAQGNIRSVKATLIPPVPGCLLFIHSPMSRFSPQSDYKCLKGRNQIFPNPSTVSRTKWHYMYTATSVLSTLSSWAPGLFPTSAPFKSVPSTGICHMLFCILGPRP